MLPIDLEGMNSARTADEFRAFHHSYMLDTSIISQYR
jgi:hypothetical protein